VDGRPSTILHVSQIAALLGMPPPVGSTASVRVAWDLCLVLESWVDNLEHLDRATMVEPTPSRGRSIRNLTVNTFHPIVLLPSAFEEGRFDWYPEDDDERERRLTGTVEVHDYATCILDGWKLFLLARDDDAGDRQRVVSGPRGTLTYAALLESQRWHAAWHLRQVLDHCARRGIEPASTLGSELIDQIGLPARIY
jgi:hypothetical protein